MDDEPGVDEHRWHDYPVSLTYAQPITVRGDPDELERIAATCRRTARFLREDVAQLRSTSVVGWSGPAARTYSRSVRDLPADLSKAADSYETVARALSVYAVDLRAVQRQARRGEADLDEFDGLLLAERHHLLGGVDPTAQALRERRMQANEDEQRAVRRRLGALADDAALAAGTATCRVRSACDAPRQPPNLFEQIVDAAGDWVQDHARVLTDISFVLKTIAGIAGVLSLVPGFAVVCVPLGIAAGAAAVCIDAALASQRRASWASVGVDAAMTAVPGARPARVAVGEVRTRLGSVVVYRVEGTSNARISIDAQNNVTFRRRSMLYLNVGDRARAENYYRRKVADGLPGVQLKSFRVPKRTYRELSIRAVDEQLAKAFRGRPLRVDVSVARDQFGLRKADFRELEKYILPGSGKVLR